MNRNRLLLFSIVACQCLNPAFGKGAPDFSAETKKSAQAGKIDYAATKQAIQACYDYNQKTKIDRKAITQEGHENCRNVPSLLKPVAAKCSDGDTEACRFLKEMKTRSATPSSGETMNGDSGQSKAKIPRQQQEAIKKFIDQNKWRPSGQKSGEQAKLANDILKHRKSVKLKCFKGDKEACKADEEWTKEFLKQLLLAPSKER